MQRLLLIVEELKKNQYPNTFIDSLLFLLVQFRTGFCQTGCFGNGIIVADQGRKGGKLCSPIVHGHPLTSRGNVMRKIYNVIV